MVFKGFLCLKTCVVPLLNFNKLLVKVSTQGSAKDINGVFPVGTHRRVWRHSPKEVGEQVTKATILLAQAPAHTAIPRGLTQDFNSGGIVIIFSTVNDFFQLSEHVVRDEIDSFFPCFRVLREAFAILVTIERVGNSLVLKLEFTFAFIPIGCDFEKFKFCTTLARSTCLVCLVLAR